MSITITETKLSYGSLMNKSKSDLAHLVLMIADISYDREQEIERLREASENLMDVIDGMSAQHTGVLWDGVMYAAELLREALGGDNEQN